ncbi:MAG: ATP-grasp domain-containing protein [Planctomycetes bacterium]|nr:ATP-grasp domain-containing protein [Planctomycetota bacterium]
MTTNTNSSSPLTVLITCVGRRVELLQAFRAAAARLGVALRLIGADRSLTAPGMSCVDVAERTPPIDDPRYITALLELVERWNVRAVLPTIDTDLPVLAAHRAEFQRRNCHALIAEPSVIAMCRDKLETFAFLRRSGIDTPETYTPDQIRAQASRRFPYIVKPRFGSASHNVSKALDQTDLDYWLAKGVDPIVQEFVDGAEHTLDVYVGLGGAPRCVVPRRRWETRGGEVSKGVVVKDRAIMDAGRKVVERMGPSARGLVTLQCIVTPQQQIRFIEINPRFGGGAPLGIAAGADYPGWLIQELLGRSPTIPFDGFEHGLCMSRFDWSVFLPMQADLRDPAGPPKRPFPPFA